MPLELLITLADEQLEALAQRLAELIDPVKVADPFFQRRAPGGKVAEPEPLPASPEPYLTAKELAPLIGLTSPTGGAIALRWFRDGVIPAAVDEGRCVRFDLEEVRATLKKRAAKNHPR